MPKNNMHCATPRVGKFAQGLPSETLWSKRLFWVLLLLQLAVACSGPKEAVTKPYFTSPTEVRGFDSEVKKLVTASSTTCAITETGSVFCWGAPFDFEPAFHGGNIPTFLQAVNPAASLVGGDEFCVRQNETVPECWRTNSQHPVTVESNTTITRFNNEGQTCGFDSLDRAYCLEVRGRDYFFAFTYPGEKVIELAGGSDEVGYPGKFVALRPDGVAVCAGVFGCGEAYPIIIGAERIPYTSDTTPVTLQGLPKIRSIAYGCVVGDDGLVYCWGTNQFGELGTGEKGFFKPPMKAVKNVTHATRVAGAAEHHCAVTEDGGLWCWGRNTYGQVGNGHRTTLEGCSLSLYGSTQNTEYSCNGQYTPVKVLSGVKDVVVGQGADGHGWTCALTIKGGVKCWGSNLGGKVGDGLPKADD